jgi:hypothetical protein
VSTWPQDSRQIAAVSKSSGYIAQLPEDARERIGKSFGGSYSKQLHAMLAFAALNLIVTMIIACARKRMCIFGKMPTRKEATEFTEARKQASTIITAANSPATTGQDAKDISEARAKNGTP